MGAKRILIVDDEEDICEVYSFRLEEEGYETVVALNGKLALEILKNEKVDLIISDVRMPVMDGISMLKMMKLEIKSPPPLIFLSGFADISPDEAIQDGATNFLSKPIEMDELINKIKEVLS